MEIRQIDPELLDIIAEITSKGDRVEIVPVKDGIRVYRSSRREFRPEPRRGPKK